jgi:DNA-binding beta-propeller fold protein YncE
VDLDRALADEVFIPTYATALAIDPDGERIVVSSRTDGALTVVDVNLDAEDAALAAPDKQPNVGEAIASDLLGCGAAGSRICATKTSAGIDAVSAERLAQPPAPSDLIIGRLSDLTGDAEDDGRDFVATAHQRGAVALYVDTLDEQSGRDSLQLSSVISDLGRTPTSIARDPSTGLLHVTLRSSLLLRVGVTVDRDSELGSAFLFPESPVQITGGNITDFRSIAFLNQPVGVGVAPGESQALVISNQPSALVLANVTPGSGTSTTGRVQRIAEIGAGGARLALGSIGGRPLAAVSCLEGRSIYIVDLTSMETRAVVPNLSGPFGVAFDEARERLYTTDFRSSVVRIVDLSRLASPEASPESVRVIATLGRPRVVQELK